jgi:hypothetical protein
MIAVTKEDGLFTMRCAPANPTHNLRVQNTAIEL